MGAVSGITRRPQQHIAQAAQRCGAHRVTARALNASQHSAAEPPRVTSSQ
jgi:hypothetical protein